MQNQPTTLGKITVAIIAGSIICMTFGPAEAARRHMTQKQTGTVNSVTSSSSSTSTTTTSSSPDSSAPSLTPQSSSQYLEGPVRVTKSYHEIGDNYIVAQNFGTPADTMQAPKISKLRIFENGKELGPAHSIHRDIRNIGMGRFSYWNDGSASSLYFSTSDNSDPRTNGRMYTYRIETDPVAPTTQPSPTTQSPAPPPPAAPSSQPAPSITQSSSPAPSTTQTSPPPSTPTTTQSPPPTTTSTGAVYYVSPSGSDSNPGTFSAPWRSVQIAALKLRAGETAILLDGTYEEPQILFANFGSPGAPITIRAKNKWGAIISSTSGCNPAISIDKSYITIEDVRFSVSPNNVACPSMSSANAAVRCWNIGSDPSPSSPHTGTVGCTIRGVMVEASTARTVGIKTNQDFSLVENNEIHSSLEAFNNYGTIFRNNTIYGGDGWGDSVYGKGGVRNLQIYNNVVHATQSSGRGLFIGGSAGCCWYDSSAHIEAYNSVAYNNIIIAAGGSNIGSLGMTGAQDSAVFNNVVFGGRLFLTQGSQNGYDPRPAPTNPTIMNNIVNCNGDTAVSEYTGWTYGGTMTIDHNNFYNCASAPGQSHPISGDPLFVDPSSDWHLKQGSPALGTGVEVNVPAFNGVSMDLSQNKDGFTRTTPWNLGAY